MKLMVVEEHCDAQDHIARLCERNEDVEVISRLARGTDAIEAAYILKPDIMLINTQLPDMCGFELLRSSGARSHHSAIMISSCLDYANRAFAEGAVDFLLTPITAARFNLAIAHARRQISYLSEEMSNSERGISQPPRFLVGERQRRLYPLDPIAIDYLEADGNYVTLHVGKLEYLSRDSIKRLSVQLASRGFIRIGRSLLVNSSAVAYAEVIGTGSFALTLNSGACLHSTAAYREDIRRTIPLPGLSKRCERLSL